MRSSHTSRQEVVLMVARHLGPEKALDVGQRHLKIKKRSILTWLEQKKQGMTPAFMRRTTKQRAAARSRRHG